MPCDCFKTVVRYRDAYGGPGLDLDSLEIKPAQPLGGGTIKGGVDSWQNITELFRVDPEKAVLCVPRRMWFPAGRVMLVAKIANKHQRQATAEHVFCVRPRHVPVFL